MSISNPSLPDAIKNIFWMYYIPEEKEIYAMNNRKEAAFFGLTLMCALDDLRMYGEDTFESRLWLLMKYGTDGDKRKINSLFMSNMTLTSEYVEILGRVLRKDTNLEHIRGINIEKLISDLAELGNIYHSSRIKYKWASQIYKTEEEV
jgi:hypothetical protein